MGTHRHPDSGSTTTREALGAFYTPTHAVAYMVGLLDALGPDSRVWEPAGGDGAFVRGLLATGALAPDQLEVWDVNPAVAPAMRDLGVAFRCADTLLADDSEQSFTHVVGNPPYLNKQSDYLRSNRDALRKRYGAIGVNDTYALFMVRAVESLAPGGQLVFLVSDTFLTLGIHRRLREHLTETTRIDSITLLPAGVFADAAVNTAVIALHRGAAPAKHRVLVRDLRDAPVGTYSGGREYRVAQAEFGRRPGHLFVFRPDERAALDVATACPPLLDLLDGGLGMHTGDNRRYLGVVDYGTGASTRPGSGLPVVPVAEVDGATWRLYHKIGGQRRWWAPAEHCVRWDPISRAAYGIPTSAQAGDDPARAGFVVSGVSCRLAARLSSPGACWESNKAFVFFPRQPKHYPVEFFVAVLNSGFYGRVARALNHTVSLQIRDLHQLPQLPFRTAEVRRLAGLGRRAIAAARNGAEVDIAPIDAVVDRAVARVQARLDRARGRA